MQHQPPQQPPFIAPPGSPENTHGGASPAGSPATRSSPLGLSVLNQMMQDSPQNGTEQQLFEQAVMPTIDDILAPVPTNTVQTPNSPDIAHNQRNPLWKRAAQTIETTGDNNNTSLAHPHAQQPPHQQQMYGHQQQQQPQQHHDGFADHNNNNNNVNTPNSRGGGAFGSLYRNNSNDTTREGAYKRDGEDQRRNFNFRNQDGGPGQQPRARKVSNSNDKSGAGGGANKPNNSASRDEVASILKTAINKIDTDESKETHPLDVPWSFWFEQKQARGLTRSAFESALHFVGTCHTVERFWKFWNVLKVDKLSRLGNIRVFQGKIRPLWEDGPNVNGGRLKAFIKEDEIHDKWQTLVLALIGEQVDTNVCIGASLQCVAASMSLQIWTTCKPPHEVKAALADILKIPEDKKFTYFPHVDALTFTTRRRGKSKEKEGSPGPDGKDSKKEDPPQAAQQQPQLPPGLDPEKAQQELDEMQAKRASVQQERGQVYRYTADILLQTKTELEQLLKSQPQRDNADQKEEEGSVRERMMGGNWRNETTLIPTGHHYNHNWDDKRQQQGDREDNNRQHKNNLAAAKETSTAPLGEFRGRGAQQAPQAQAPPMTEEEAKLRANWNKNSTSLLSSNDPLPPPPMPATSAQQPPSTLTSSTPISMSGIPANTSTSNLPQQKDPNAAPVQSAAALLGGCITLAGGQRVDFGGMNNQDPKQGPQQQQQQQQPQPQLSQPPMPTTAAPNNTVTYNSSPTFGDTEHERMQQQAKDQAYRDVMRAAQQQAQQPPPQQQQQQQPPPTAQQAPRAGGGVQQVTQQNLDASLSILLKMNPAVKIQHTAQNQNQPPPPLDEFNMPPGDKRDGNRDREPGSPSSTPKHSVVEARRSRRMLDSINQTISGGKKGETTPTSASSRNRGGGGGGTERRQSTQKESTVRPWDRDPDEDFALEDQQPMYADVPQHHHRDNNRDRDYHREEREMPERHRDWDWPPPNNNREREGGYGGGGPPPHPYAGGGPGYYYDDEEEEYDEWDDGARQRGPPRNQRGPRGGRGGGAHHRGPQRGARGPSVPIAPQNYGGGGGRGGRGGRGVPPNRDHPYNRGRGGGRGGWY